MPGYAARRLLALPPILVGVAIVTFALLQLIPGDPSQALLPPEAPESVRQEFRQEFRLDAPIYERFGAWLWNATQGDLGESIATGQSARSVTLTALRNTAQLAAVGALFAIVFGVVVGLATSWWANSFFDRGMRVFVVAGASMPTFWVGLVLVYLVAIKARWLPTGGQGPITGEGGFLTWLEYITLPALTVAILPAAVIARLSRALFLEVRQQEFVVALRTRGYSTLRIWRHVLRNAAPGVVNIAGLQAGYLILGTLFVEVVFVWPGIGEQLTRSISQRDYPVIQAIILATGVCFTLITLATDLLLRSLDPRVEAHG
jgi:peptide/nickel transport system permease protein